jgi:Ca-activated chloride channel family protein
MALLDVQWLWALWAVPVLLLLLRFAHGRALRRRGAFLGELAPRLVRGGRGPARTVLVVGALVLSVLALARPAWGVYYERVESEGVDVVVLLDVSRSMLAEDATPDRLRRARIAVGKLVDRLDETGGHRIGLVAFAGTPSVRCPLTLDYGYYREVLDRTGPDAATRGGTLIGDAVRRGLDLFDESGEQFRALVLLTDGEDHESFPLEAARAAAERGVSIIAIGIGDAGEGARIPFRRDDGTVAFVEHDGKPVVSRLDEETLLEMAKVTGGAYVPAGTRSIPLDRIYDEAVASRQGDVRGGTSQKRLRDRFQWVAGLALVLVLVSRFAARKPEALV